MNTLAPVRSKRQSNRGFTLIEIVVALLVLAIASAAIFEGFSIGFRNARTADDFSQAILIAQSKLAPAGVSEPLSPGTTSGRELDKYDWTVNIDRILAPTVGAIASIFATTRAAQGVAHNWSNLVSNGGNAMKCLYYLAPTLASTRTISDDLYSVGVSDWYIHVISRDGRAR